MYTRDGIKLKEKNEIIFKYKINLEETFRFIF